LQLHGLVYPVVEFHQASSTLDVSLSYRTLYATTAYARPPERLGHRGGALPYPAVPWPLRVVLEALALAPTCQNRAYNLCEKA
jgi:hypothetical protein